MGRNIFFIIFAISFLSVFLMIGCGKDGEDGSAFVALDWVYAPQAYADNNPAIPDTFYQGQNYRTSPGTYNFSYTAWDGSSYSGTFTVTINEGEDGDLFEDGEDGDDKYYKVWLYSWGPEIDTSAQSVSSETVAIKAAGLDPASTTNVINKSEQMHSFDNASPTEIFITEKVQGRYSLRLEYMKVPASQ